VQLAAARVRKCAAVKEPSPAGNLWPLRSFWQVLQLKSLSYVGAAAGC
jgi:hypothetical protein